MPEYNPIFILFAYALACTICFVVAFASLAAAGAIGLAIKRQNDIDELLRRRHRE
jgi:hypothetical protein